MCKQTAFGVCHWRHIQGELTWGSTCPEHVTRITSWFWSPTQRQKYVSQESSRCEGVRECIRVCACLCLLDTEHQNLHSSCKVWTFLETRKFWPVPYNFKGLFDSSDLVLSCRLGYVFMVKSWVSPDKDRNTKMCVCIMTGTAFFFACLCRCGRGQQGLGFSDWDCKQAAQFD